MRRYTRVALLAKGGSEAPDGAEAVGAVRRRRRAGSRAPRAVCCSAARRTARTSAARKVSIGVDVAARVAGLPRSPARTEDDLPGAEPVGRAGDAGLDTATATTPPSASSTRSPSVASGTPPGLPGTWPAPAPCVARTAEASASAWPFSITTCNQLRASPRDGAGGERRGRHARRTRLEIARARGCACPLVAAVQGLPHDLGAGAEHRVDELAHLAFVARCPRRGDAVARLGAAVGVAARRCGAALALGAGDEREDPRRELPAAGRSRRGPSAT